jgi:AcrR family transcriptional regulator
MSAEEGKEAVMDATFQALCKHGYADLSMQKIADESSRGKSLIYYHFENKDELMLEFMDLLADDMEERFAGFQGSPREQLNQFLQLGLGVECEEIRNFRIAMLEMRSQGQHNEELAKKMEKIDNQLLDFLETKLDAMGFQDPEMRAEIIFNTVEGVVSTKMSTQDEEEIADMKDKIDRVLLKD